MREWDDLGPAQPGLMVLVNASAQTVRLAWAAGYHQHPVLRNANDRRSPAKGVFSVPPPPTAGFAVPQQRLR